MRGVHPEHRNPLDPRVWRDFLREGLQSAQVRRGTVGWPDEPEAERYTITAGQDVDLHVTRADGMQLVARLYAGGGLWSIPPAGEEVTLLAEEADWHTPGAPVALWKHRLPPAHLVADKAVLEVPSGGLLIGDGATKPAARKDDETRNGALGVAVAGVAGTVNITLTYTPPGGTPQVVVVQLVAAGLSGSVTSPTTSFTLSGAIDAGSSKTSIE